MYKLAVFDLDGTILDTLEDLTVAVNYALAKNGLPTRTGEEVCSFVGNGIVKLIERAVGDNMQKFDQTLTAFKAYYQENCAVQTKPYEGIVETLEALKAKGIKLAVLSNKAHGATAALADRFFEGIFDTVAGEREAEGIPKKPAPDALFAIMDEYGATSKETAYIGDSEVDIQTAKNAKADCISVAWGLRSEAFLKEKGARIFVKTPLELLGLF